MKVKTKSKTNPWYRIIGISAAAILLASLAFKQPLAIISATLIYLLLVLLPGLVWAIPLKQGVLTTFALANLIGFASGALYVLFDVVLGIPLNRVTFIIVPLIVIIAGFVNTWRLQKQRMHHGTV